MCRGARQKPVARRSQDQDRQLDRTQARGFVDRENFADAAANESAALRRFL